MLNREGDMGEGIEEREDVGQRGRGTWEGSRGVWGKRRRQGIVWERERERERDVKRVLGGECGGEGSGEDCERNVEHG